MAAIDAPAILVLGEPFAVSLTATFATPAEVNGAVVYVGEQPGRHILVASGLVENGGMWSMDITGLLAPDEQLKGMSFTVHVALKSTAGMVGAYSAGLPSRHLVGGE